MFRENDLGTKSRCAIPKEHPPASVALQEGMRGRAESVFRYRSTASWALGPLQRENAAFCSMDYYFFNLLLYRLLLDGFWNFQFLSLQRSSS